MKHYGQSNLQGGKGLFGFHFPIAAHHQAWQRATQAGTEGSHGQELAGLASADCSATLLIARDHLPRDGTAHVRLGPPA